MNNFISFTGLKAVFRILLNKINPIKTKYLRANEKGKRKILMKKELSKAIMPRNKLRN